LTKDIRCRALRHVRVGLSGHGHLARLDRVLVLPVVSTYEAEASAAAPLL
jgi:hypothetical protein